ncbi:hypothetical protein [Micromonospora auratinigra]|uniref:Uncharacterized protein n=1 Tax=Micromonospora auratinigra TaxID=261654 RepID=A0A1A8ZH72_9ACTN|nr:hypothetical protein [Micromonospora auratinigra]SBT43219.1 hypothetical protein GA0070611_2249 [Micromonospora auratinigra]
MSDSYPPYGGQPDPHAPWGGQPTPPGSYPGSPTPPGSYPGQPVSSGGYPPPPGPPGGYPGQPAPFGAPVPPPSGSKKGLIVGLSAAAVVLVLACCGGGIGLYLARDGGDDPKPIASGSTTPGPAGSSAAPTAGPEQSESEQPTDNDALTARYSSDMSSVCEGSSILNAAPYSTPSGAKALVFANAPDRPSFWSQKSFSSAKSYYTRSSDFAAASVVGCLKVVDGSEGAPKKCDYKNSEGKRVTVSYISSRYQLTFYAAKTGEKIGDGGTVNAPATRCPSFISYNKITMKSYAAPDPGTMEAALDKFLG